MTEQIIRVLIDIACEKDESRVPGVIECRRLDGRVLARGYEPLLDAARVLIAERCDPEAKLVSRWVGKSFDAMTWRLDDAARLAVKDDGSGPKFVPFRAKGPPRSASASPARPIGSAEVETATEASDAPADAIA